MRAKQTQIESGDRGSFAHGISGRQPHPIVAGGLSARNSGIRDLLFAGVSREPEALPVDFVWQFLYY
jgi:hypothetical protein